MNDRHNFCLGPAFVNPLLGKICIGGREVKIEPQIMHVLECLAAHPGQVVTREELLTTAWPDTMPGDGVLAKAICVLRKALGDKAQDPRYIETIPKVGYRLIMPVTRVGTDIQRAPSLSLAISRPPVRSSWLQSRSRVAALTCSALLAGVLMSTLFFRSADEREYVTVLKTYDVTSEGGLDSTVVHRTFKLKGGEKPPELLLDTIELDSVLKEVRLGE